MKVFQKKLSNASTAIPPTLKSNMKKRDSIFYVFVLGKHKLYSGHCYFFSEFSPALWITHVHLKQVSQWHKDYTALLLAAMGSYYDFLALECSKQVKNTAAIEGKKKKKRRDGQVFPWQMQKCCNRNMRWWK